MHLLRTQLTSLPKRFQNAFAKRTEENMIKFFLPRKDAEDEALLHVGRLVYIAEQKAKNRKAQLPLFGMPQASERRGLCDVEN